MAEPRYDVVIIGGGVAGLGVALEITRRFPRKCLLVLEKRERCCLAATASLVIGKSIVDTVASSFGLS